MMKYRTWRSIQKAQLFLLLVFFCVLAVLLVRSGKPPSRSIEDVHQTMTKATHDCESTPWMRAEESEMIAKYLLPNDVMFEYGSGHSSCVWSHFVKELISVEHDKKWHDKIKKSTRPNQRLVLVERELGYAEYRIRDKPSPLNAYVDYVDSVGFLPEGPFVDKVLIDGRARPQCAYAALSQLRDHNSLVFIHDWNSLLPDRTYYRTVLEWFDVIEEVAGSPGLVVLRPKQARLRLPGPELFPEWWYTNVENGVEVTSGYRGGESA